MMLIAHTNFGKNIKLLRSYSLSQTSPVLRLKNKVFFWAIFRFSPKIFPAKSKKLQLALARWSNIDFKSRQSLQIYYLANDLHSVLIVALKYIFVDYTSKKMKIACGSLWLVGPTLTLNLTCFYSYVDVT